MSASYLALGDSYTIGEAVAESARPVLLYSMGKDSSVLLHLARKAFYPSPPPFPLLHVDTTWKFREMIAFRDRTARELGLELIVHRNPDCVALGVNPFDHGSARHTDLWKTQGLRQALDQHRFDLAPGCFVADADFGVQDQPMRLRQRAVVHDVAVQDL